METRNQIKVAKAKLKAHQDKVEQLPNIGDEVYVDGARGVVTGIDDAGRTAVVKFDHRFTATVNIDSIKIIPAVLDGEDEWPQVGDEVVAVNDHNELKGKLLALTKKYAIIHQGNDEQHLHLSAWALEKPKTPEEELRDSIVQTIHDDVYHGVHEKQSIEIFANVLMSKYNITKKQ